MRKRDGERASEREGERGTMTDILRVGEREREREKEREREREREREKERVCETDKEFEKK